MLTLSAVKMSHMLLGAKVANAKCVVDATAGNGKDTLFLALNTPEQCRIWAFDIQQQALSNAEFLLKKYELHKKVTFVLDSHANILNYVKEPVDIAMFNLGYLPGGTHDIVTEPESTIQALTNLISHSAVGGIISVVAYPGHPGGRDEHEAVREYLTSLPQRNYTVASWSMVNQINNPPVLYIIEKVRSGTE